jgi:hypothetical protein
MQEGVEGLRRVGAGLRLVLMGLAAFVILMIASIATALILTKPGTDPTAIFPTLVRDHPDVMTVLIGLDVLASVLVIAGVAFCMAVPIAAGATAFVVMALVCDGTGLALRVIGQASGLGPAGAELAQVAPLFGLFGYFAFLRFLRRLAEYLGSPSLAARGRRVLVGSSAIFFASFLAAFGIASGGGQALAAMVGLLLLICGPFLFVLYARLLNDLRRLSELAADKADEGL